MKLKKYLALLCALAMLLVLAGCGGQGAQTVTPDANDPQIEGNEAADPAVTGEDNESGAAPAVPKTGDVTGEPDEGNTSDNSPTESANSETEKGDSNSGSEKDTNPSGESSGSGSSGSTTPQPTPAPTPTPTPTPHTHSYKDTRTEPTCTQDGKIVSKCSCGDTKTTTLPKLGHDYKENSRTAATCTQDGKVVYKCSRCGDTRSETVAALGHDFSVPVYEEQTYEIVVGYECHTICGACGADLTNLSEDDFVNHTMQHALNGESSRTYQEWIEVTETVTENVLIGHKCSRCGITK